jgi:quercetin dioxygenase-like cupin family protein
MSCRYVLLMVGTMGMAVAQTGSKAVTVNLDTAKWTQDKDSSSVMLHSDASTGGMEMLVRFPGGHVIPPHYHDSNERIIVLEGQLTLKQDEGDTVLNTGGYAYLPAKQVQKLSCSSTTRCTFYLGWDGKPQSHAAK